MRGLLDEVWAVRVDPGLRAARQHIEFGKAPGMPPAWVESVDERNAEVRATLDRADLVVRSR